jgi:hypothetical protein
VLVTPDAQLQLADVELVDASVSDVQLVVTDAPARVGEDEPSAPIAGRYLAAEADRIAARASTAGTRRQYASIYRTSRPGWRSSSVVLRSSEISMPM